MLQIGVLDWLVWSTRQWGFSQLSSFQYLFCILENILYKRASESPDGIDRIKELCCVCVRVCVMYIKRYGLAEPVSDFKQQVGLITLTLFTVNTDTACSHCRILTRWCYFQPLRSCSRLTSSSQVSHSRANYPSVSLPTSVIFVCTLTISQTFVSGTLIGF